MVETAGQVDLRGYLQMLLRRRYLFVGTFFVILSVVIVLSIVLPKEYEASTIVLVEASPVVNPLNRDISPSFRAQERLALLKHLLFNRHNIERVTKKLDLDVYVKDPFKYEALIKKIQGNLRATVKGSNLFQVSYVGVKPVVVRDIVNTLASQYIEDNLSSKRRGSSLSMEFHSEQVKYYSNKLDEAENAFNEFKVKNVTLLPKMTGVTLARIREYQGALTKTGMQLKELEVRRDILKKQIAGEEPLIVAMITEDDTDPNTRLILLEKRLTLLLLRYTENYPDVIKTKGEIEALKKLLDKESAGKDGQDTAAASKTSASNPLYQKLRADLVVTETEITTLKVRKREISKEVSRLEGDLEDIPSEEQELVKLQRDVKIYESIYNTLLGKLEEANITREIESKEEAVLFKVIDAAVLPVRPAKPDRVLFIIAGFLLGIGGGVGMVFCMENYLDTSFKGLDDIRGAIDLPVLATVPAIITKSDALTAKRRDILVFSMTALYLVAVSALFIREVARKYGLEVLMWGR